MEKQLASLFALLPQAEVIGSADKVITDVTADSRAVVAGSLFICLKGLAIRVIFHSHVYSMKLTSSNPIIEQSSDPSPLSLKDFGVYDKNRNRDGKR